MPRTHLSVKPAFLIMLVVLVLDQLTKLLIRMNMELYQSIPVLKSIFGDTFMLTYVENTGAAFSLSPFTPAGNRIFFIVVSILAVIFVLWLLYHSAHRIQVIAFGFVLAGALGNLIDRIRFGGVTDFIDCDFPDFIMQRWPIFNVADSAIFIAMTLIIIDMIFIHERVSPSVQPLVLPVEETDTQVNSIDSSNKEI
ncbi:MAG TPA: signal peptidase II [Candidatus Cloacimonadota bacterium]|nr:signal peptidase II [Candidatus Cloacimonadota bacterium]